MSEAGRGFCRELAPEAPHTPRSRHLAHSLPCEGWRTDTLHHPVATLTPVWLPPKYPHPFPRHVKGPGQRKRKDKCFAGKSNLSQNCPASVGSEAHEQYGAWKWPLNEALGPRWRISKVHRGKIEAVNIAEKRLRGKWALRHRFESWKQALSTSCRGCVLRLHQDSGSSLRLILQEAGEVRLVVKLS